VSAVYKVDLRLDLPDVDLVITSDATRTSTTIDLAPKK
jgi:hypothetical protein